MFSLRSLDHHLPVKTVIKQHPPPQWAIDDTVHLSQQKLLIGFNLNMFSVKKIYLLFKQVNDRVWGITNVNGDHKMNENLASSLVVPHELVGVKDSELKKKLKNTLLTLSWMHPATKSFLARLDTIRSGKGKSKSKGKDSSSKEDVDPEEVSQVQAFLNCTKPKKATYVLECGGTPFLLQLKKAQIQEKVFISQR